MANKKFRASDAEELRYLWREEHSIFEVPPFQRAYTWNASNINDLWNSILENEKGYFIGNMVWEEKDGAYLIIDGQQRMFTLALILIALENHWKEIRRDIKDQDEKKHIGRWLREIHSILYFENLSTIPNEEQIRLSLAKDNLMQVFRFISENTIEEIRKLKGLNGRNLDENQKVFTKNYKHIFKLIKDELDKDDNKIETLMNLTEKIISLYIIPIKCESDVDAYKIFEGLNATGIDLSTVDLVKNAVMYSIKDNRYREQVEALWEDLENLFETTKWNLFQKFLRHHWIAMESYVSNSKLFEAIKEKKLTNKTSAEIIEYTEDLLNCAKLYVGFRVEDKRDYLKGKLGQKELKQKEIQIILDYYDRFGLLPIEQVYEVILSITLKFLANENFTFKQYTKYLDNLWAFVFRASITSMNPSEYEKLFSEHCSYISTFKKNKFDQILSQQKNIFAPLVHSKEKENLFISEFKDSNSLTYRPNGNNSLITYILRTIIEKDNPSVEVKEPTIEHILPQDPKKWNYERSEIEEYVNKIGNLTCLNRTLNQKASNLPIKEKYEDIFSKSVFPINKSISEYLDLYTEDPLKAIEKRASIYADRANEIWQVN